MRTRSRWDEEQIEYLKNNYTRKDNALLAEELGKSTGSVYNKLNALGLTRATSKGIERKGYKYINNSNWKTNIDTPCPLLMPCHKCGELKPCDYFYIMGTKGGDAKSKRIDIIGNRRQEWCKVCVGKSHLSLSQERKMVYSAKQRANQSGLSHDIKPEDIFIPKLCPILGIRLKPAIGGGRGMKENPSAPSLDRVENEKGYTKDNICVISKRANSIKSDGKLEEILSIAVFIADYRMGRFSATEQIVPYANRDFGELIDILIEYNNYVKDGYLSVVEGSPANTGDVTAP